MNFRRRLRNSDENLVALQSVYDIPLDVHFFPTPGGGGLPYLNINKLTTLS